jgi:hypothetical protein
LAVIVGLPHKVFKPLCQLLPHINQNHTIKLLPRQEVERPLHKMIQWKNKTGDVLAHAKDNLNGL